MRPWSTTRQTCSAFHSRFPKRISISWLENRVVQAPFMPARTGDTTANYWTKNKLPAVQGHLSRPLRAVKPCARLYTIGLHEIGNGAHYCCCFTIAHIARQSRRVFRASFSHCRDGAAAAVFDQRQFSSHSARQGRRVRVRQLASSVLGSGDVKCFMDEFFAFLCPASTRDDLLGVVRLVDRAHGYARRKVSRSGVLGRLLRSRLPIGFGVDPSTRSEFWFSQHARQESAVCRRAVIQSL